MVLDIILEKIKTEDFQNQIDSIYQFNGQLVPRVTHILSAMLHEDYLMNWANSLGWKRQNYKKTLETAADKGSFVHNSIENYIQEGVEPDFSLVNPEIKQEVYNAYNSFLLWWEIISQNQIEIVMQEQTLICPYFGGTLDLLLSINGNMYLFDFKTSNNPSYKYFMQLSIYRYMLKTIYNIDLAGVGIIMLDKKSIHFEEIMAFTTNEFDLSFINACQESFLSLVYAYYNRLRVEQLYKELMDRRKGDGGDTSADCINQK